MKGSLSKNIWVLFFILSGGVSLFLGGIFLMDFIPYVRLDTKTVATVKEFFIESEGEERFVVGAVFTYKAQDRLMEGKKKFSTPVFISDYGAKSHLNTYWKTKEWDAWYNNKDPSIVSLQKLFPFQKLFNFLLSIGVMFYFLWLRSYLRFRYA